MRQLVVGSCCFLLCVGTCLTLFGRAPQRSGQPYAEKRLCVDNLDVIFCEDFDYPENFNCTLPVGNGNHRWRNAGWAEEVSDYVWCGGRQINPATDYPQSPGLPHEGHVWVANWDPSKGDQGDGASWGKLLRDGGATYANGSPRARDLYVRMQIYWTPDYAWPGDPKTQVYGFSSGDCIDNKILFLYPSEGIANPTNASFDAGPFTACGVYDAANNAAFADALAFRVGDVSDNYKSAPLCGHCQSIDQFESYGPFESLALRNPSQKPTLGRVFRFNTGRWYTFEFRYKLSDAGQPNGLIEAWIDGTKIYHLANLPTCGSGLGDCSGIGALYLGAYHNGIDPTTWDGQQVVDNLVISRAYIGPPNEVVDPPTSQDAGVQSSDARPMMRDDGATRSRDASARSHDASPKLDAGSSAGDVLLSTDDDVGASPPSPGHGDADRSGELRASGGCTIAPRCASPSDLLLLLLFVFRRAREH